MRIRERPTKVLFLCNKIIFSNQRKESEGNEENGTDEQC